MFLSLFFSSEVREEAKGKKLFDLDLDLRFSFLHSSSLLLVTAATGSPRAFANRFFFGGFLHSCDNKVLSFLFFSFRSKNGNLVPSIRFSFRGKIIKAKKGRRRRRRMARKKGGKHPLLAIFLLVRARVRPRQAQKEKRDKASKKAEGARNKDKRQFNFLSPPQREREREGGVFPYLFFRFSLLLLLPPSLPLLFPLSPSRRGRRGLGNRRRRRSSRERRVGGRGGGLLRGRRRSGLGDRRHRRGRSAEEEEDAGAPAEGEEPRGAGPAPACLP